MSGDPGGPKRRGGLLFASLFLVLAVFLLSRLGAETTFSAKGKLFAQPAFWPAVGVIGMSVFGALHWLGEWAKPTTGIWAEGLFWLRALEYLAWFMVYVQAVPLAGYLPATLVFTTLLAFRAGYRRARHLALAAATGFAIVFVFKALLGVKIPGGALYEWLPNAIRGFMVVNF